MSALLARLKEPSSYAALAAVLAMIGIQVPDELWHMVINVATAVAGLVAFLLPEGQK